MTADVLRTDKYSLWIVPTGEARQQLDDDIKDLASRFEGAPIFTPHITMVADIRANTSNLASEEARAAAFARSLGKFTINLGQYGYTSETFRSLYRFANSPELTDAYFGITEHYPQAASEHFMAMPHLSLLYGDYPAESKDQAIQTLPTDSLSFEVTSLELYRTNDPIESWEHIRSFPLCDTNGQV